MLTYLHELTHWSPARSSLALFTVFVTSHFRSPVHLLFFYSVPSTTVPHIRHKSIIVTDLHHKFSCAYVCLSIIKSRKFPTTPCKWQSGPNIGLSRRLNRFSLFTTCSDQNLRKKRTHMQGGFQTICIRF